MKLNQDERASAQHLISLALAEDLGDRGDVTSWAIIPPESIGAADLVARSAGIVAGLEIVALVIKSVDDQLSCKFLMSDGQKVFHGDRIAVISGPVRSLLVAERTLLNFLQRLSGIATLVRQFVEAAGSNVKVLDTRKTTPGWRLLEKYAVRCGGGHNHRVGLFDQVLIKDNHLAALGGGPDAVLRAVSIARAQSPQCCIEVEVNSMPLFTAAVQARPDIIMLDNMKVNDMKQCVEQRDMSAPGVLLEASGGVSLATIGAIAATGVDRISVGALTHSPQALDIALDYYDEPRSK